MDTLFWVNWEILVLFIWIVCVIFQQKVSEYDLEMPQQKTHYLTAVQTKACVDPESFFQRGPTLTKFLLLLLLFFFFS